MIKKAKQSLAEILKEHSDASFGKGKVQCTDMQSDSMQCNGAAQTCHPPTHQKSKVFTSVPWDYFPFLTMLIFENLRIEKYLSNTVGCIHATPLPAWPWNPPDLQTLILDTRYSLLLKY